MMVDVADFIGTRIYHFGVWEPHVSALISARLKSGDVFCDIGANIGYYTVLAAPIVGDTGKVVAIEPSPATFELLKQNIKLNNADNVRMVRAAVADQPGTLTLFHAPDADVQSRRDDDGCQPRLYSRSRSACPAFGIDPIAG